MRSQKDGKAGKNLKVTGVVHVLLVQVNTNLCSQYSIDITCLAQRYIHSLYNILRQARGVLAMDGGTSSDPYCKVVALSFNSWLGPSFYLVSHHCFPLPLATP